MENIHTTQVDLHRGGGSTQGQWGGGAVYLHRGGGRWIYKVPLSVGLIFSLWLDALFF